MTAREKERARLVGAHVDYRVPLLPSGPDGVSSPASRRAWPILAAGGSPRQENGGDERARTADPYVANVVLSQLSYIPTLIRDFRSRRRGAGLAERQGFEPWEHFRAQRFSRPPRSTTPAPLHLKCRCGEVAESLGFEPRVPCGTHDFQSCRFDHSRNSPPDSSAGGNIASGPEKSN